MYAREIWSFPAPVQNHPAPGPDLLHRHGDPVVPVSGPDGERAELRAELHFRQVREHDIVPGGRVDGERAGADPHLLHRQAELVVAGTQVHGLIQFRDRAAYHVDRDRVGAVPSRDPHRQRAGRAGFARSDRQVEGVVPGAEVRGQSEPRRSRVVRRSR